MVGTGERLVGGRGHHVDSLPEGVVELSAGDEAEDVGRRFPEEARSIAKGEKEKRILRGLCTSEEAKELRAEGIPCSEIPDFLLEKQN